MPKPSAAPRAEIDRDLQRYAYGLAGPRDCILNLLINGAVAWWVFREQQSIPLTGTDSIFKMLLPIAFIESVATTFFGYINGVRYRCRQDPGLHPRPLNRWLGAVGIESIVWGCAGLLFALAIEHWLKSAYPDQTLTVNGVVAIVGIFSGVLAYVLHARAVLKSSTLLRLVGLIGLALCFEAAPALAEEPPAKVSEARQDAQGVLVHDVESSYQAGMTKIRVLRPEKSDPGTRLRVVYLLPVEARDEDRYGDGLREVVQRNLHRQHSVLFVAPTFSHLPWYADHPADRAIRQESYFLNVVIPFVEKTYSVEDAPAGRLLAGFSKSGWGAWSLLLRHPDVFGKAAAWDAPLWKERPDQFGMGGIFGTQDNFEHYSIRRLLEKQSEPFQKQSRLVLTGFDNFRDHHVAMHQYLVDLKIPHEYRDGPKRKHDWHSGWLGESLDLLLKPD